MSGAKKEEGGALPTEQIEEAAKEVEKSTAEVAAETKQEIAKVERKIEAAEIAGASESSVHALMEQLKELNAKLDNLPGVQKTGRKRRWLPF